MGVGQKDVRALLRWKQALGLKASIYKSGGREMNQIRLHGATAKHVMENMLWPFLGEAKKEQYLLVLEAVREHTDVAT